MSCPIRNHFYPVPKGWISYSVDDIKANERNSCVAGPFGSKISSKYFVQEGVPVIRGNNLRGDLSRFVADGFVYVSEERARSNYAPQYVKAGDLVFTCWGTIGQVGLIPGDGPYPEYIISNKQLKLRVNRAIADPLFCFYYFASPAGVEYIRNRGIGGAVPGINLGILKSLPIALPSLETQQGIVNILVAYDDQIENNRRRMALLEESARLLYQEWFVHLRFPGREHTRVIAGVPEGWERAKVGSILFKFRRAKKVRRDEYLTAGAIPCIDQGTEFIGGYTEDTEAVHSVPLPIIVFGDHTRTIKFADFPFASGADGTQLIYPNTPRLSTEYLYFSLKAIDLSNYFYARHFKFLKEETLVIPNKPLLSEFTGFAQICFEQIHNLRIQSQKLRTVRDLLLPKLMSGEIAV
jgi:type I restriction enzyme, S subunit